MSGNLSGCPVCPLCAADEASTVLGSMPLDLLLTAFLLCLSGLFSGLTLGLMSLDVDDLKIIIDGGKDAVQSEEVGHALKVLTVREKGNLLLCTLLLGNTLVNALIAILSASFTSGIIGAFAATGFIVIFGEIMPQSFCSRYGLLIGAKTVWLVKIFIVLLYPVAWPISAVLDWVLGEEMRLTYTKQELVKLVELHEQNMESEITQADSSLLKGALKFSSIRVKDIMTERVMRGPGGYTQGIFMLDINGKLDFDTILEMYKRGHTRVPICDGDPMNPQNDIVGLILTKDLMLVDPDDTIETRTLLHYCGRQIRAVPEGMTLGSMLELLVGVGSSGNQTHLFFVQPDEDVGPPSSPAAVGLLPPSSSNNQEDLAVAMLYQKPLKNVIGLVTLEDVIEELIQREIIDETDEYRSNKDLQQTIKRGKRQQQELHEREAFFRAMVQKGPRRTRLSEEEVDALTSFLCLRLEPFRKVVVPEHGALGAQFFSDKPETVLLQKMSSAVNIDIPQNRGPELVPRERIKELLLASEVVDADPVPGGDANDEAGGGAEQIYQHGESAQHCTVVLSGRVKITAGMEGFVSESGAFTVLAASALTHDPYITDFSAKVVEHTRLVRISRDVYQQMLQGPEPLVPESPSTTRLTKQRSVSKDRWQRVADVMPKLVRHARAMSEPEEVQSLRSSASMPDLESRALQERQRRSLREGPPDLLVAGSEAAEGRSSGGSGTDVLESYVAQELQGMPVSALKQRARDLGLGEQDLSAADDESNPKKTIIRMISSVTSPRP